jgi:uncharacterized membrane protein YjgN (DUF898 family)
MSCFLELNSFAGNDQEAAAKKLALMFRMAPQQAKTIIDRVAKGHVWRSPSEISDQQAAVAENYLKGIGFQVGRFGQQEVADQIVETMTLERESPGAATPPTETSLRSAGKISAPPTTRPSQKGLTVGFHGTGGGLFKIMLINWILTIFTLGIYYFWGKTKVRRYLCDQSSFAGDRFYYHGTGGELFKGAVIFGAILSILKGGTFAAGTIWGPQAELWAQLMMPYVIVFLLPVIMVGAFRYRLSRTAWRGIRFSFRGMRKSALWLYIKGYLSTLLTLGLYWPYFSIKKQKFWRTNAYFGSESFNYEGEGKDIFQAFLLMVLLFVTTMGTPFALPLLVPGFDQQLALIAFAVMCIPLFIGYLYYTVFLDRYHWSKTRFAGGNFNYNATGRQWFMLNFTNFLLIVFTAGLALPLATVRSRKFLADHLSVVDNMQLSQVVQEAQKSSALGEGAADGFDMDIDIGF